MPNIVLLNAPPRAGKDTLAGMLAAVRPGFGHIVKFAAPIKRLCCAAYCGGNQALWESFDNPEMKDVPHKQFQGLSCRQVQISASEDWLKKLHSDKVFGQILANELANEYDLSHTFFVSDSGFRSEAEVLVETFGTENVKLVRIHRQGHSFAGDSRSYIDLADLNVPTLDVTNRENDKAFAFCEIQAFLGVPGY